MKLWYLTHKNAIEYAVVFAENETKALEKLFAHSAIEENSRDASVWEIEEFTEEKYNGVLYFY